MIVIIFIFVCF